MKTIISSAVQSMAACALLAALPLGMQTAQAASGKPDSGIIPTAYHGDGQAGFIKSAYFPESPAWPVANDPMTGMWEFTFVSTQSSTGGPPPGLLVDSGFISWHDDGTDLIHSSHVPETDAICEGIWHKIGNTYQVDHWALPWNVDSLTNGVFAIGTFAGPANIQAWITLDRGGKTFSGTFKITLYKAPAPSTQNPLVPPGDSNDPSNVAIPGQFFFDTSGGVALEIVGAVKGARVSWKNFPHSAVLDQ